MRDEPNPARGQGAPLALVLLAAFGSGIAGGLVAHWLEGDSRGRPEGAALVGGDAGMTQFGAEMRALAEAIDALAQRPALGPAPGEAASPREPEPLRPDSAVALEAAIERLADQLANAGGQHPVVADRGSLRLPDDTKAARSKLLALRNQDAAAVKSEHLLLTMQAIVERYGIPDRVSVDAPIVYLKWKDSDGKEIEVRTYQGIVVGLELPR